MSTPPPTTQQQKNVQDILENRPLTGQQVMVPLTTKAFFPGTLRPTKHNDTGEEQVLMNVGKGILAEMTLTEAVQHLQATRRKQSETESDGAGETKKGSDSSTVCVQQEEKEHPSLPYFEIREEYDDHGREIRAEAINIAKELEYFERKKEPIEKAPPVQTARPLSSSRDGRQGKKNDSDSETVSEQQYEALSKRLDELTRLEEEADRSQLNNKKSSKQLQSKGWAKGFLSKDATSRKKQTKKQSTMQTDGTPITPSTNSTRKVGFETKHEVREIPRVGQKSVAEIKPKRAQLDEALFSGVVKERPMEKQLQEVPQQQPENAPQRKRLSRFAQERRQQQER